MANENSPSREPKEKQPASQPSSDPPQEKPFNWPTVDPDDIPEVIREHQNTRVAEFGL
jgi:hypothetical protein